MAGICFFFEENDIDVWSGRTIDLDAWNYAAKAAGDIDKIIVVNKTDKILNTPDINFDFKVVKELPDFNEEKKIYVCCPWNNMKNSISLWDFNHDVDWYIFGPASGWKSVIDYGLYVPQCGIGALHSTHIASIVLLHRYKALWQ